MTRRLYPARLTGTVAAPPSKSAWHRELICRFLAGQPLPQALSGADVSATLSGLRVLRQGGDAIDCGASGATLRFLLPLAMALGRTGLHLTGTPRLLERPLSAPYPVARENAGYRITEPLTPGRYALRGDETSQTVSGLLMALPLLAEPSELVLTTPLVSRAYVDMTLDALRRHGIPASCGSDDLFAAEEIRFLFALLQIIDNPHQDIPLLTVLLSPFGGYPADALARLRAGDRDADLYTLLCESKAPICAVLEDLRRTAQEAPLRTLLEEAEERLLLPALCAALPNGPQRQRNLAAFRSIADSYERAGGCGLPGFLRHLEGLRERGVPSSGGAAAGAVRLMIWTN
mgnify:CR=1 FL=1